MKNRKTLFWIIFIILIAGSITLPPFPFKISLPFVKYEREIAYQLGLDLQGGTSITLEADMQNIKKEDRNDALESAKIVIERRVDLLGVREPVVQTAKVGESYRVIVELAGVKEVEEATRLVGATAQLTFWELEETSSSGVATGSAQAAFTQKTDLTGSDLRKAMVTFSSNTGKPEVALEFGIEGTKKFGEITERNVGKPLAIALDNEIIQAPVVNEAILGGRAVISGNFSINEAKNLAIQLNAGALPVPLKTLQQRNIGATLGAQSVQKSLVAGAIGFALVALFMILFYRVPGFLAVIALGIYTLIVLAIFKLIPITLTLAGIAGFVLSVGMAVDANILIFERFKEEIKWGKPKNIALEEGFRRAWTSIRDSNISSLITCAILYYLGTGAVRGFALVLAIGILVSMFSAIIITRTFLRLVFRN